MERAQKSLLEWLSPFICLTALVGIPAAGWAILLLLVTIPRFNYGGTFLLLAGAEICCLIFLLALILLLRAFLARPSAPRGVYRAVLDFLAMTHWSASVKVAFVGLLVLPAVWFLRVDRDLLFLFRILGWRAYKVSGDFRDDLDRLAVAYQLVLMGGVPLLFFLHLFSRWQPQRRVLAWVLLPLLFVATAVSVIVLGTIAHFANN
jgi:hypothetical protein